MSQYYYRYGDTPISRKHPSIKVDVFPDTSVPRRTPRERPPNYPGCNDDMNYFMAMACLASLRSKDPTRQVAIGLILAYLIGLILAIIII